MMRAKTALLWVLTGIAFLLFVASFRGMGTGLADSGVFTHLVWSYIFGLGILAIVIWHMPWHPHGGAHR